MTVKREKLATRLHFAAVHLLRRLRSADAEHELSPADLSVLSTLINRGELTMSELALAEQVRPPSMTRRVQSLEAGGYVLRKSSPADARVSLVRHTTRGWTALQSAAAARTRELARSLGELDRNEVAALEEAVDVIERLAGFRA